MTTLRVPRLVKAEDLNHNGTLYAGRLADWFVEACFLCAAQAEGLPGTLVCLKIHDLVFKRPFRGGGILFLETRVVRVGTSSLTVSGKVVARDNGRVQAQGKVTFVCVDERSRPMAHGLRRPPARITGAKSSR